MSILNLAKCHFLNLIFAGFSMLNFFWDTSVARRVSTPTIAHKTLNINNLPGIVVETQNFASLLPQWNDNFDTPSTATMP